LPGLTVGCLAVVTSLESCHDDVTSSAGALVGAEIMRCNWDKTLMIMMTTVDDGGGLFKPGHDSCIAIYNKRKPHAFSTAQWLNNISFARWRLCYSSQYIVIFAKHNNAISQ